MSLLDSISSVPETLKELVKNHYIKIIILIAIFTAVSVFYYQRIVVPRFQKQYVENREFIPAETEKTATLYYFCTTWCPICKKATVEWNALKSETNGIVKGTNIIFKEIDCDQDSATADKFNITGYPTIKLVYNDKTYEYDAKPNKDTLIKFLNEVL